MTLHAEVRIGQRTTVGRIEISRTTNLDAVVLPKERALAKLDANGPRPERRAAALTSIQSDLRKHPATADHSALELGALLAFGGHLDTDREVREWIDGFR